MDLHLERPLLFFDIESTGLNIAADSIVELSFVKIFPDNEQRIKTWRVCPWDYEHKRQKPINPEAAKVTGITDEELKDEPKFSDIADEVLEWLADSDLSGFNSAKFDLPLLAEEIERVRKYTGRDIDIDLHEKRMIDVQTIYHTLEPRNLKAAYRFYCGGQDYDGAHSAEADTIATYEVLKGQLDRYPDQLKNDVKFLSAFGSKPKPIDYAGRLIFGKNNEPTISFGKNKDKTAREVYETEPAYFGWIQNSEFTLDTKRQFEKLKQQFDEEKRKAKAEKLEAESRKLTEDETRDAAMLLAGKFNTGKFGR